MIQFGTSGWRSIIAEEFTFSNVRKVVQAIATHLVRQRAVSSQSVSERRAASGEPGTAVPAGCSLLAARSPVVVGYDPRFLSPEFAQTAAELLARNGLPVLLSKTFIPTPAVSFQIIHQKASGGVNFTASHNPANYNGIKFNMANGAPASKEVTHEIESLANGPDQTPGDGVRPGKISWLDARPAYFSQLRKVIDTSALKKAKLRVGADVLYGAGMGYLDVFLQETGCHTVVLHNQRDATFGGYSPEPAMPQLAELKRLMRQEKLKVGLATDGDADRFGIMDEDGTLLMPNDILPIVLQHLVKTRGWKGLVVRSVMTSHFIDAVARHYQLELKETPVGFKYIGEAMMKRDFVLGGEESGGLSIRGHVPEKDGILACLLMAEVRAVEKKSFRQILSELRRRVGPYYSDRINLHLSPDVMQGVRRRMETFTPNTIGPLGVKKIVRLDGFKFIFEDDSWLGVRLSGTEPVVRLYVEASSPKKLNILKKVGTQLIQS